MIESIENVWLRRLAIVAALATVCPLFLLGSLLIEGREAARDWFEDMRYDARRIWRRRPAR